MLEIGKLNLGEPLKEIEVDFLMTMLGGEHLNEIVLIDENDIVKRGNVEVAKKKNGDTVRKGGGTVKKDGGETAVNEKGENIAGSDPIIVIATGAVAGIVIGIRYCTRNCVMKKYKHI